jgi:hypothetical protein
MAVSSLADGIIDELGLVGKIVGKTTDAASAAQLSAFFGPGPPVLTSITAHHSCDALDLIEILIQHHV